MKQTMSSIKKAMGNLILSGKSEPKKLKIPKIKVKNIWSKHSSKFSTRLQTALNHNIYSTIHEYHEPIFTTLKEPLAKLGYIKGSLLSLGKIRLMDSQDSDVAFAEGNCVLCSYY